MIFSHTFPLRIWRLFPDTATGQWLVETRDAALQQVVFYAVSAQHQAITPLPYPGPWACGIAGVHDGIALIHGYENGALPVRDGLWAFDTQTGDCLWAMPEGFLQLGWLPQSLVVAHRIRPEMPYGCDLRTGLPLAAPLPPDWQQQAQQFAQVLVPAWTSLPATTDGRQGIRLGKMEVWVAENTLWLQTAT